MGLLNNNPYDYYGSAGDHGSYRYISLEEIIDSFNATYVGKNKLCEDVSNSDVAFHAIRGLQELSYDTLRSTKDWEVVVPSTLVLVMPIDYVNYVKLSWSDSAGIERVIYPAIKTSNPNNVSSNIDPLVETWGGWITDGNHEDLDSSEDSDTWASYKSESTDSTTSSDAKDDQTSRLNGRRYGIDPQHAQANGSFFVDETAGKFHFSSNLSGKTLVLKYISDGIATKNSSGTLSIDLETSLVPKLAEEAIYKHMLYGILSARKDTPGGLLGQLKKERFAETRKAKIRLSNFKAEEITQIFRGNSKQIKH